MRIAVAKDGGGAAGFLVQAMCFFAGLIVIVVSIPLMLGLIGFLTLPIGVALVLMAHFAGRAKKTRVWRCPSCRVSLPRA